MIAMFVTSLLACTTPEPEETPLEGPGFDEATGEFIGEGETFVVALSHLQVKNRPSPGGRFGDHAEACGNDLFDSEPPGWLGAAFRNVGRLDWWTMTVWADERSMLEWVVSEPHSAAMRDFSQVAAGGEFKNFEVTAEELPMSWDRAMWELFEAPDTVAGSTNWFADGEL